MLRPSTTAVVPRQADELLAKINEAVKAADDAQATLTTAQAELVLRSKTVGLLLLEAKKLHPAVKDFETFLKRVDGLKLSRAYDLLRLAGGRTTEDELKRDARERKQRSRASKKMPRPIPTLKKPEPRPEPVSVTEPPVTETAEATAEKREPERKPAEQKTCGSPEEAHKQASTHALSQFEYACRHWLPRMTAADRRKARQLVLDLTSEPKAEAA
jgi:outer membrane biosynthesis protein TonB